MVGQAATTLLFTPLSLHCCSAGLASRRVNAEPVSSSQFFGTANAFEAQGMWELHGFADASSQHPPVGDIRFMVDAVETHSALAVVKRRDFAAQSREARVAR